MINNIDKKVLAELESLLETKQLEGFNSVQDAIIDQFELGNFNNAFKDSEYQDMIDQLSDDDPDGLCLADPEPTIEALYYFIEYKNFKGEKSECWIEKDEVHDWMDDIKKKHNEAIDEQLQEIEAQIEALRDKYQEVQRRTL